MLNFEGCGRKRPWPNVKYYSRICLDGLRDTKEPHSASIVGLYFEIENRDLTNKKQTGSS
jgi:hypothetical protein